MRIARSPRAGDIGDPAAVQHRAAAGAHGGIAKLGFQAGRAGRIQPSGRSDDDRLTLGSRLDLHCITPPFPFTDPRECSSAPEIAFIRAGRRGGVQPPGKREHDRARLLSHRNPHGVSVPGATASVCVERGLYGVLAFQGRLQAVRRPEQPGQPGRSAARTSSLPSHRQAMAPTRSARSPAGPISTIPAQSSTARWPPSCYGGRDRLPPPRRCRRRAAPRGTG